MRTVFFGSDLFSYPSLKAIHGLIKNPSDLIVATRLLKPSGRGQNTVIEPPVVSYAKQNGLKWLQIETLRDFENLQSDFDPQLAVAVSYGKLIPALFINNLEFGGLNVHPSLLPQYRGAAPLQRAIMDLQPRTGVSVQTLHPTKFDHGRLLWQKQVDLSRSVTLFELRDQLAELGAMGLSQVISEQLLVGDFELPSTAAPSVAPLIDRREFRVNFKNSAAKVDATGRALGKLWFEQEMTVTKKRKTKTVNVRVNLEEFVPLDLADNSPPGTISMQGTGETAALALRVADGYIGARCVTVAGFGRGTALDYFTNKDKRGLSSSANL
ncbi:Methionyl-tRNA formyltransferase [Wickerhamiella sorbophila]|uniref:methionyl-tRNA formyltransferase n=1 Tax=Wickerhamiella sorbophila TaxID=45607 RepID=A0A2T0FMN6_9ASCO|nr:Methionyl-tRNA formyltransferase [Wickerhamiella sorbophila]PRT56258.1 Methionyl-tRNA formyltransferase [Wickerhamiella sorbophila]